MHLIATDSSSMTDPAFGACLLQAAGIDSPGLAGSPAIAIEVVRLLKKAGLATPPNPTFNPYRRPIIRPKHGWKGIKIGHEDPEKNVVCKCEKVTEAEIVDAIRRPLQCISTQAIRKRTRAGMGHCQGPITPHPPLSIPCPFEITNIC
jgi:glycerol-3-phosphate dehydrogenase